MHKLAHGLPLPERRREQRDCHCPTNRLGKQWMRGRNNSKRARLYAPLGIDDEFGDDVAASVRREQ